MQEVDKAVTAETSGVTDVVSHGEDNNDSDVMETEPETAIADGRQRTICLIPRDDKKTIMKQLKGDLSLFNCNIESGLGILENECSNALIPLKHYDEMTGYRTKIAFKIHAVRCATQDVRRSLEELELELKCCPFALPSSVLDQNRPDHLVCLSTQQIENLCKRKSTHEFEDEVNAKRRKYADYVPDGGKALPKHDDGVALFVDILTRLSSVEELVEVIDFPQKKFLSDVSSLKKWFKSVNSNDPNRARAYAKLCGVVKRRETTARELRQRDLISEDELTKRLNVASEDNVKEVLECDFLRLCKEDKSKK